jgi:hypothetical protein
MIVKADLLGEVVSSCYLPARGRRRKQENPTRSTKCQYNPATSTRLVTAAARVPHFRARTPEVAVDDHADDVQPVQSGHRKIAMNAL